MVVTPVVTGYSLQTSFSLHEVTVTVVVLISCSLVLGVSFPPPSPLLDSLVDLVGNGQNVVNVVDSSVTVVSPVVTDVVTQTSFEQEVMVTTVVPTTMEVASSSFNFVVVVSSSGEEEKDVDADGENGLVAGGDSVGDDVDIFSPDNDSLIDDVSTSEDGSVVDEESADKEESVKAIDSADDDGSVDDVGSADDVGSSLDVVSPLELGSSDELGS